MKNKILTAIVYVSATLALTLVDYILLLQEPVHKIVL
jgi:hypothetical protein